MRPEVKGIKKKQKVKRKRARARVLLLHLKHTSIHAHTLQLSLCLSGPVSWLRGLWDSPARWQPFLSQAGKTGSEFFCLCASDSYSQPASEQRASVRALYFLFICIFFFQSVTAARLRTPICIGVHTKGKKSGSTNRQRHEEMN